MARARAGLAAAVGAGRGLRPDAGRVQLVELPCRPVPAPGPGGPVVDTADLVRATHDNSLAARGRRNGSACLARDLEHDRQVAIKVLRPELAAVIGAERILQHPRIAGLRALVPS